MYEYTYIYIYTAQSAAQTGAGEREHSTDSTGRGQGSTADTTDPIRLRVLKVAPAEQPLVVLHAVHVRFARAPALRGVFSIPHFGPRSLIFWTAQFERE